MGKTPAYQTFQCKCRSLDSFTYFRYLNYLKMYFKITPIKSFEPAKNKSTACFSKILKISSHPDCISTCCAPCLLDPRRSFQTWLLAPLLRMKALLHSHSNSGSSGVEMSCFVTKVPFGLKMINLQFTCYLKEDNCLD